MASNKGEIVYCGNFSDSSIAEECQIHQGNGSYCWKFHNQGGRDEDIYFRYDSEIPKPDTSSIPEATETLPLLTGSIVSPPIQLSQGVTYNLTYEMRLFGTTESSETMLMIWSENGNRLQHENEVMILEHKKWPLDGFQ